jgi:hypothetical protein
MKVVIHSPSLPVLVLAILLDLPVLKVRSRVKHPAERLPGRESANPARIRPDTSDTMEAPLMPWSWPVIS